MVKLTSKTIPNEKIAIIDAVVSNLIDNHKVSWSKDKTVLSGTITPTGSIIIKFPEDFQGDFSVSFDKEGEKLFSAIEKKASMVITEGDVKKSVFTNMKLDDVRTGPYLALGNNVVVLQELDDYFKKLGVHYVNFGSCFDGDKEAVSEELMVVFRPRGLVNSAVYDNKTWEKTFSKMPGYAAPGFDTAHPKTVMDEKVIDLMDDKSFLGKYFVDRNIVFVFPNIFTDLSCTVSLKDNKYITAALDHLSAIFKTVGMKKTVSNIGLKLIVSEFNKTSRKRIKELEESLTNTRGDIKNWEQKLTKAYGDIVTIKDQLQALTVVDSKSIDSFIKELDLLKTQEIVENVELKNGCVNITFKPTTIKAKVDRKLVEGKPTGPLFEMFVGRITVSLKGDGSMTATCDNPCGNGSNHPHINKDKYVCLGGESEGRTAMTRLVGEKKLTDFAYVFWMFIKTWRYESDHYCSPPVYIDDRLAKGLPVFDQTGARVVINDPELIKKGILKKMDKAPEYEKNITLYKDFRPQ